MSKFQSPLLARLPAGTELRSIDSIIPYINNPNRHTRRQIRKLMRSLEKFGWTNFIIIDSAGNLICGHGRLEAAKLLGETMVPVRVLDDMSEADRKAYIIADNQLAKEAQWSRRLLRSELSGLIELGYDLELTGFDTFEIDGILNFDADGDEGEEDRVDLTPICKMPVAQVGDLWVVGEHRLVVGDARDPLIVARVLAGELARAVVTDPPYGCRIENNVSGLGRVKHKDFVMGAEGRSLAEFAMTLLRPAFQAIAAHSEPGAIAHVFSDWRAAPHMLNAAEGVFHEQKNWAVWAKNPGLGAFYRSAHEFCLIFKVSPGRHVSNIALGQRNRSNLWRYPSASVFGAGRAQDLEDHPTVKNKFMIRDAILDVTRPGDVVLDSFAGSGTTGVACEMAERRAALIELDPIYADVILRRLTETTGCEPLLDGVTPLSVVRGQRLGDGA